MIVALKQVEHDPVAVRNGVEVEQVSHQSKCVDVHFFELKNLENVLDVAQNQLWSANENVFGVELVINWITEHAAKFGLSGQVF